MISGSISGRIISFQSIQEFLFQEASLKKVKGDTHDSIKLRFEPIKVDFEVSRQLDFEPTIPRSLETDEADLSHQFDCLNQTKQYLANLRKLAERINFSEHTGKQNHEENLKRGPQEPLSNLLREINAAGNPPGVGLFPKFDYTAEAGVKRVLDPLSMQIRGAGDKVIMPPHELNGWGIYNDQNAKIFCEKCHCDKDTAKFFLERAGTLDEAITKFFSRTG